MVVESTTLTQRYIESLSKREKKQLLERIRSGGLEYTLELDTTSERRTLKFMDEHIELIQSIKNIRLRNQSV